MSAALSGRCERAGPACDGDHLPCQTPGMPSQRVTLAEVARRAGVSRTTASFVLSGRSDMRISEEAHDRVLRAARELNYRPNLMARSLRTKVTHTIALVSDTIATEQYAGQVVLGALAATVAHEHMLFVAETEGDPQLEARVIEDLLGRQVDGFIYAKMYTQAAIVPRALRGQRFVLLNCATADQKVPAVVPDEVEAGRTAARALLDAGHAEGIYLLGEPAAHTFAGRERVQGIEEALALKGARIAGIIDCYWWPESAYEALSSFLHRGGGASALICLNDRIAFGAYQALQVAGRTVPGDVSIVSFDDSDLASWLRPPLSSLALPHHEMGRRAVELLLAPEPATGVERLPMPLRQRGSIAPPRRVPN